ncbi:MAG: TonB-dependent receptor [Gammaproteobacteria bacterium]|nr:TonB-dependent receptor [Gammaproteobacteria bacterium]
MYIKNDEEHSLYPTSLVPKMLAKASIVLLSTLAVMMPAAAQDNDANADLEEVVVTGLRGNLQSAQKMKLDAEQIIDSIVADDIANLPDRSVTETLQRIPGVTIDRFITRGDPEHLSGEGTGVAVRGLPQVRGEINGRDGFTANGGRALSFEDVPPELMAGVDVYKNPSADMIEGGLGGTVNLRTRMPFDIDERLIGVTLTANYQNFIEETTPGMSAIYSDRWDTGIGEVGFLIDVAHSELKGRIDVIFNRPYFPYDSNGDTVNDSYIPRGADWRTERTERERQGLYTALQIRPNDNIEYFLTVFHSRYDFTWDEDAMFVSNDPYDLVAGPDTVYDSNGIFQSGTLTDPSHGGIPFGSDIRISNRESITTDVSTGVEWQINSSWSFNSDLQYVKSTTDALDATIAAGVQVPDMFVDASGGIPRISTDSDFLANPDNYYAAFTMDHEEDNTAEQLAVRADAEYTFSETPGLNSLKFGVRFADRDYETINTDYNWKPVFQPWMQWWAVPGGVPLPNISQLNLGNLVTVNRFDNFFRGDLPIPGSVVAFNRSLALGYPDTFIQVHQAAAPLYDCCYFTIDPDTGERVTTFEPTLINPSHVSIQEEDVSSAYLMLRFGWDDIGLDGNVGARWVQTKNLATGYVRSPGVLAAEAIRPSFMNPPQLAEFSETYTHTLPSLNLRWKITDEFLARFAYSKAIARPNVFDLRSSVQLYVDKNDGAPDNSPLLTDYHGSAYGGNPRLRYMEADQLDLAFEWYYSDIGSVWLNLFSKDISNFIRVANFTETYYNFDYVIQRPMNQEKADVKGWELGWRHFFDFGFGMEFSYTNIDSDTTVAASSIKYDTDGSPFNADAMPYEGLSENSYSAIFMFEDDLISARLAYTWRDEFLLSIGANGYNGTFDGIRWDIPVYQDDYGQWDGSVFFNITEQYSIGLEANNLTNEKLNTIQKQNIPGNHIASATVQDTRYALTFRASF